MFMKRIFHIAIITFVVLLNSCEEHEIVDTGYVSEKLPLEGLPDSVYFLLSHPNPQTRVVYQDEFRSLFEKEDLVGCFALNGDQTAAEGFKANACYRVAIHTNLKDGTDRYFLAPLTAYDDLQKAEAALQKNDAKYLFYYPYDPDVDDLSDLLSYAHNVLENQNKREWYESSDLLWDICEPDREYSCVHVQMDHAMSNIIVEVSPDLIDPSIGEVPSLLNVKTSIMAMNMVKESLNDMTYTLSDATGTIQMWEFGKAVSGNYMFRAVVPSHQTFSKGMRLLELPNNAGAHPKIYTCSADVSLLPGKNYYFTLGVSSSDNNGQVIAPTVTDEDTWVFDLIHPDTNEPLGLLCKEYVYFQPGGSLTTEDKPTGTAYNDTKYISSQAWVMYPNKDSGVPDLNTGYVLKFITDVRYVGEQGISGYWPAPHVDAQDTGGGLFTPSHGHTWVYDSEQHCGVSSTEGVEHYMHGGKIIWDGTSNKITNFIMPVEEVTNEEAANQGHIAIDDAGKLFLCYRPITDDPPHKIALIVPHNLVDRRVSKARTDVDERVYPLIKIGYNQFWMSYDLRAATQIDGTPITNYNTKGSPGVNFPDRNEIGPGYIFSYTDLKQTEAINGNSYSVYDPYNQFPTPEEREAERISPMYNFLVHEGSGMLPLSMFDNAQYYMPTRTDVMKLTTYLGWHYGAKLMTRDIRTRNGLSAVETEYEALKAGKYTEINNANRFGANICGFDLRAEGYYFNSKFEKIGTAGSFAVIEDGQNMIFSLPYYLMFGTQALDSFMYNTDVFIQTYDNPTQGPWVTFSPIRFFLKFNGQDDTGGLVVSSLSMGTKASAGQVERRDIYVGVDEVL